MSLLSRFFGWLELYVASAMHSFLVGEAPRQKAPPVVCPKWVMPAQMVAPVDKESVKPKQIKTHADVERLEAAAAKRLRRRRILALSFHGCFHKTPLTETWRL